MKFIVSFAIVLIIGSCLSYQNNLKVKRNRFLRTTSLYATKCKSLLIWDCDGVLVDSEALLKQGEVEALEALGFKLSSDDCVRLFSGVSPDRAAENFLNEFKESLPGDFFKKQIEGSMDLFRRRLIPLMYDTVTSLHNQQTQMCVASGSPRDRVTLCLEVAKMKPYFTENTIFTRELVRRSKPAPDLFLHAAEKMGVHPSSCLVVEDSTAGIEAALAAEMEVIGFLGGGHASADWYREAVRKYAIPLAYTQQEVLGLINSRLCQL
mmetsp:Transcript_2741/g.3850  ORF Transcript_2741/g.3850 Transcript_2741/m.3850 type:complete len:265 (+) Transcript_2741:1-795(+)